MKPPEDNALILQALADLETLAERRRLREEARQARIDAWVEQAAKHVEQPQSHGRGRRGLGGSS